MSSRVSSRTVNSTRNILSGVINKAITIVFPFVIRTIINQKLGAEYLGLSSLFKSVLTMLSLAELGISSAIVFSMYKPIAEDDNDLLCALLNLYRKVYLIIGTVGATFYLLGVGILYLKTGSLNMTELHSSVVALYGLQSIKASLLFIVIGLSIKIAFFPFHSWLPFAYSKTISPVSALMSPIVTKVSLFALIKVLVLVFGIEYVLSLDSLKTILPVRSSF